MTITTMSTTVSTTNNSNSNSNSNTNKNKKDKNRFQCLLQSRSKPPPKTATVKRLERLLDEKVKGKDKDKDTVSKEKRRRRRRSQLQLDNKRKSTTITTTTANNIKRPKLNHTIRSLSDSLKSQKKEKNVLAFRGGLASAPTFRKAIKPVASRPTPFAKHVNSRNDQPGQSQEQGQEKVETVSSCLSVHTARRKGGAVTATESSKHSSFMNNSATILQETPRLSLQQDTEEYDTGHPICTTTDRPLSECTNIGSSDEIQNTSFQEKYATLSATRTSLLQKVELNATREGSIFPTTSNIRTTANNNKLADRNLTRSSLSTTTKTATTAAAAAAAAAAASTKPIATTSTSVVLSRKRRRRFGDDAVVPINTAKASLSQSISMQVPEVPLLPSPSKNLIIEESKNEEKSLAIPQTSSKLPLDTITSSRTSAILQQQKVSSASTDTRQPKATTGRTARTINDNFIRLNLRNSAGACRGARNQNKMRRNNSNKYYNKQHHGTADYDESDNNNDQHLPHQNTYSRQNNLSDAGGNHGQAYVSRMTGLDPMDDYLDGVYGSNDNSQKLNNKAPTVSKSGSSINSHKNSMERDGSTEAPPMCARHQRPCKLIIVKKNTKGNKGRKFYACSMPRGEQCDHFEWAEDTLEAAKRVVQGNSSHSSFVARQVAAHVNRFRPLTVPELKEEAERRHLNKHGKKSQLLMRLALWARDEILKAVPYPKDENDAEHKDDAQTIAKAVSHSQDSSNEDNDDGETDGDESGNSDSSDDELEFTDVQGRKSHHFDLKAGGSWVDTIENNAAPSLNAVLKSVFGYNSFRDGQEWAIQNCLDGKRSLLIAPTGFGKSLCYALPASLMSGVCVVVSPLISLIQDQLRSLPPRIPAATLSGSISAAATAAILDDVVRNRIKILFVSPERLTSPSFRRLFNTKWNSATQQLERKFPEISLLCVDEAHCVSQWAHNFRPCFLRFKSLLHLMSPRSVLAVTATAGPRVIQDITTTLGIERSQDLNDDLNPERNGNILIIDKPRDNIDVSCQFVANHEQRIEMLSGILQPKISSKDSDKNPYAGVLAKGSVIVYVWRQRDTEVVAENLISSGVKGGVVVYHGGMDASARTRSQSKFMRGKARICVATVAFGMGIDKADVEGIIHLNLSSSPEHYLQEIGRAGRDGRPARAIALPTIDEIPVRHSLIHSNFISKSQIRSLLYAVRRIVIQSKTANNPRSLSVALPSEALVTECDCKIETIETLLSILEQNGGDNPLFHIEGFNYDHATIALKKRALEKLALVEPIAACIKDVGICSEPPIGEEKEEAPSSERHDAAFQRRFLAYSSGAYTFSVAKCANALGDGAESRHVFAALRRLQNSGDLELALDTSSKGRVMLLKVSEKGLAFFNDENISGIYDKITDGLFEAFSSSCVSGASKVLDVNFILEGIAANNDTARNQSINLRAGKSKSLQKFQSLMREYFSQGQSTAVDMKTRRNLPESFFVVRPRELENDLYSIIRELSSLDQQAVDNENSPILGGANFADYTAVSVTKFLHGLDSARAPAKLFRSHPLFGKWREVQFCLILQCIEKILTGDTRK